MKTLEQARRDQYKNYYKLKCPYCGAEIVVGQDELHKEMFEPHEEAYKYWQGNGNNKLVEKIGIHLVSSDPSKDIYKDIKCPNCGHLWDEKVDQMYEKYCNPDGSNDIVLRLNDVESERAREFMKKHNHQADFKKQGKTVFSATGMQFTYTITPGGLGPLVSIRCNHCGEIKEITDTESW